MIKVVVLKRSMVTNREMVIRNLRDVKIKSKIRHNALREVDILYPCGMVTAPDDCVSNDK